MVPAIASTLSQDQLQKSWKAAQDFEAVALNEFLKPIFDTVDLSKSPMGGGEAELLDLKVTPAVPRRSGSRCWSMRSPRRSPRRAASASPSRCSPR